MKLLSLRRMAFLLCFATSCAATPNDDGKLPDEDGSQFDNPNVAVRPSETVAPVDSRFLGTNFLFWIEDDQSLADGKIASALKKISCPVLRYPGGTVADNFHWRTASLDNKGLYPHEDGADKSDFDEFMTFCNAVGAEPILVVNTRTWFLKDDIEGGAQNAADWVRYCRQKGYNAKHWEIGNETYWQPLMTAAEYGRLVKVYAREMKKADPDIKIGANGHWDTEFSGVKERIDPSLWEQIKNMYLNVKTKDDYNALQNFENKNVKLPITSGDEKWWANLTAECADDIDAVSVHWYYYNSAVDQIDAKISELKKFLSEKTGKEYPVWLTEYNCNTEDTGLRVLGLLESLGRFLNSGVDLGCFWPLRMGGDAQSMMTRSAKNPQYPYQIFELFSHSVSGNMVKCEAADGLYVFACDFDGGMTIVVSGRSLDEQTHVRVDTGIGKAPAKVSASLFSVSEGGATSIVERDAGAAVSGSGVIAFSIDPVEFAVLRIRK